MDQKRRSGRKQCHIKKLPNRIILYISNFLIIDDVKSVNKNDLRTMAILFPECKEKYKLLLDHLRFNYYLRFYSGEYWDVRVLAIQQGIIPIDKFPSTEFKYSVVNVNDSGYVDNGEVEMRNDHIIISLIDGKGIAKLYYMTHKLLVFGKRPGGDEIIIHTNIKFSLFRLWDRILIDRKTFPFLDENNIYLKIYYDHDFIEILPKLTVDKFKDLIALKHDKK